MALNLLPEYPTPVNPANRPGPTGPAAGNPQPSLDFQEMLSKAVAAEPTAPAAAPAETAPPLPEHTIRRGDTLSEVVAAAMRQQGIRFSRSELYAAVNRVAADNQLANPNRIFPGQKIRLDALKQTDGVITAAKSAPSSAVTTPTMSSLQPPAHGRLTSLFGMRNHPVLREEQHHDGIDISLPTGSPIQPVAAGTVTFAGENGGYGLLVEVAHENGLSSRYAHLSETMVSVGEQVSPGNTLGLAGQSGLATGSHLHLEIRRDRQPINPLLLLSRERIETGPLLAEAREAGGN